ncbi:MAG: MOSC domain-containing protein [Gemmatimonadaceae bacterium]|nr:MOSC domain-containing protein [Gemmatimonadaceae bacterium]
MTQTTPEPLATAARVRAIFAGPIRTLRSPREPDGDSSTWKSAILKSPATAPVHVGALGLAGDAQKEKAHHGGPTKAVLVYGAPRYAALWDHTLRPHAALHAGALRAMSADVDASLYGFGAFGENITVSDLDEHTVFLGDLWQIGECVLQITEPRGPCATLTRRWMRPALLDEVKETAAAGWYNAVHTQGHITVGDRLTLVARVQFDWSVARVFDLLEQRVAPRADVVALRDAFSTHDGLRARLTRQLSTAGRTID